MLVKLTARFLSVLFLFFVTNIYAQQKIVRGKIVTDNNNPVQGATITVKGTSTSTLSDNEGAFSIAVPNDAATLVITFVGYSDAEITVAGKSDVTVTMKEAAVNLNEVVVTGYSTQRKKYITGAVSSVSSKELQTNPANNFAQKLQGKVPGVTVVNSDAPGGTVMVRIRGIGSVTGVNDPLYVIDGVPTTGGLSQLNPNDVEDIQVLKDASASSIYGARANNGVIIVTTKKGKVGDPRINFYAYGGVQKAYNPIDAVTPQQLAQLVWDNAINTGQDPATTPYGRIGDGSKPILPDYIIPFALEGDPLTDPSHYSRDVGGPGWLSDKFMITGANKQGTDWFDVCTRHGVIQNYDLSVSGGSDKAKYFVSGSVYNQDGILNFTDFIRYTARVNTELNISKRIRFGENMQYAFTKSTAISVTEDYGLMGQIYTGFRLQPVYDIMGYFSGDRTVSDDVGAAYNPYATLYRNKDNHNLNNRFFGNAYGEAELIKNLVFRTTLGVDYSNFNASVFVPAQIENSLANQKAQLTVNNNYSSNLTWTNLLTYTTTIARKHFLKTYVGTEAIKNRYRNSSVTKTDFAFEDESYRYLSAGSTVVSAGGGGVDSRLFSYFGKLDYAFNDRYLLSATVRRDASSRFAPDKRWGTFPAVSAGWIISEEKFMNNVSFISNLKLRASWGITGNQEIDPYNQYTTYTTYATTSNYDINGTSTSVVQGFQADRIGNPQAQWEEQVMKNIGIDAGLVSNKLFFSVDVYNRQTRKLLLVVPGWATAGQNTQPAVNIGKMENKGIDIGLNYNGEAGKDFKYQIGAVWSRYKNQVTELYGGSEGFIAFSNQRIGNMTRTQSGYPIAQFYGYINDGIFQTSKQADDYPIQNGNAALYNQPGRFIFRNTNGDSVINSSDQTYIGSPHPKFTYGLTINLQYKNVDFSIFLQGVYGNKIFNFLKFTTDFFAFATSPSVRTLDSWTPDNPDAVLPKTNSLASGFESQSNTYYIENGSYLRGKTITIGYNFSPKLLQKIKVGSARLYVQATNVFTITKYKGIDPEVPVTSNGAGADLLFGVDKGTYPFSRTFLAGLQIGL